MSKEERERSRERRTARGNKRIFQSVLFEASVAVPPTARTSTLNKHQISSIEQNEELSMVASKRLVSQ